MDHIVVTDQMAERVQQNVVEKTRNSRRTPLPQRIIPVAATLALVAVGAGVAIRATSDGGTTSQPQDGSGLTATYTADVYSSPEQLSLAAGFAIPTLSYVPFEVHDVSYLLLDGGAETPMAEITYDGESLTDGAAQTLTLRVDQSDADNSGDYRAFDTETTLELGDATVVLRGFSDGYYLAIWQQDGLSISASSLYPLTLEEWQAVLDGMQMVVAQE